jgi:hypothetical protein
MLKSSRRRPRRRGGGMWVNGKEVGDRDRGVFRVGLKRTAMVELQGLHAFGL